ncbi:hypothetical protein [Angustibacter aerolatus]|uniref:Uncharacterized protein n=1 Tax=Angustibacter aerolatus TaxID=1162965 RepID=A0ABQ6JMZ7_9ACTN|nr:hypothetical protein GCM10025868_33060 [Angustibacter aerolatus]
MRMSRFGLSLAPPAGWEARIYRREPATEHEVTHPVVHACTRALPAQRGDFGSGVVDLLGPQDVFVSLVEFGTDVADQGLFEVQGRPTLRPSQFRLNGLQRSLPDVSAAQHFYSEGGRAFCLLVVLGAHSRRMALVPRAEAMVGTMQVTSATALRRQGAMP